MTLCADDRSGEASIQSSAGLARWTHGGDNPRLRRLDAALWGLLVPRVNEAGDRRDCAIVRSL
jgi:hypothetical protein